MTLATTLKKARWIPLLIGVLSSAYIIYRLSHYQKQFSISDLPSLKLSAWICIILAQITLLVTNICLESKKWQLLIRSIHTIKFSQALKMVLAGIASGIFTPAKMGEPMGRILFIPKQNWAQATLLTYLGGMIGNMVIFIVAVPFLFIVYGTSWMSITTASPAFILIFSGILFIGFIAWNKKTQLQPIIRQNWVFTLKKILAEIASTPKNIILQVFLLSLLRFIAYCMQLGLMLWAVGTDFTMNILFLIPVYFMMITLMPSVFLVDLGIRGSVALFLFSSLFIPDISIVLAVSSLWILNQVVPSLIGICMVIPYSNGINTNNGHIVT